MMRYKRTALCENALAQFARCIRRDTQGKCWHRCAKRNFLTLNGHRLPKC